MAANMLSPEYELYLAFFPGCRTIVLRRARFDAREADFYEALYTQSRASFGAYVETGTLLNNYAHIFDLLIRWGVVETGGRTARLWGVF